MENILPLDAAELFSVFSKDYQNSQFPIVKPILAVLTIFLFLYVILPALSDSGQFIYQYLSRTLEIADSVSPTIFDHEIVLTKKPEVREFIGSGNYGNVYKGIIHVNDHGRSRVIPELVAIKKIHERLIRQQEGSIDENYIKFKREIEMLRRTTPHNPNIVRFIAEYCAAEEMFIVLELMYQTLKTYIKKSNGIPNLIDLRKQVLISLHISLGLKHLHGLNPPVMHRDLHSDNILTDAEGTIFKITDFGVSKALEGAWSYATGNAPGNFLYMPPEAVVKRDPESLVQFTRGGDIFSLGVNLLHVSTQSLPTCGLIGVGVISEIDRRANDLNKLNNDHPLKPIILKCLRDSKDERPTAIDVCSTLQEIEDEHNNSVESSFMHKP